MKRHLCVIAAFALLATPAMAGALKRAASAAQKCSHSFIKYSVSHGNYDPSIEIAAASLQYCEAPWQKVALLIYPELTPDDALALVKQTALEPLTFDVFTAKDHL